MGMMGGPEARRSGAIRQAVVPRARGPQAISTTAMMPLLIHAVALARAMIRPARAGSGRLNSATYLLAVNPIPNPASVPNMPMVFWMIPSSPYSCLPNMRPTRIADTKPSPREISEPASDQSAPFASR